MLRHAQARSQARTDLTGSELIEMATAVAWVNETTAPPDTAERLLDLLFEGLRPR
ncbi:hypothetical protein ACFSTC_40980 [Nonomuraea ferruginea]